MTIKITKTTWETLSAYLDGELTPKKQSRLEKQLITRADLRTALEELRRTRAILRSQPPIKAPRNFTLSPGMVGLQSARSPARRFAPRLYPVFQLTSALASVLFVLVMLGDILVGSPRGRSQFMADESAKVVVVEATGEPVPELAAAADAVVEEVVEQEAIEEALPAMEVEKALDLASATSEAVARSEASAEGESYPAPSEPPAEGESYPAPDESPAVGAISKGEFTEPTPIAPTPIAPTPLPSLPQEEDAVLDQSPILAEGQPRDLTPVLRLAEITLAILAIATGFVALYFRRILRV